MASKANMDSVRMDLKKMKSELQSVRRLSAAKDTAPHPGRDLAAKIGPHCDYLNSMIFPEGTPPRRVPDNVVAESAVFKQPFIDSIDRYSYEVQGDPNTLGTTADHYNKRCMSATQARTLVALPSSSNSLFLSEVDGYGANPDTGSGGSSVYPELNPSAPAAAGGSSTVQYVRGVRMPFHGSRSGLVGPNCLLRHLDRMCMPYDTGNGRNDSYAICGYYPALTATAGYHSCMAVTVTIETAQREALTFGRPSFHAQWLSEAGIWHDFVTAAGSPTFIINMSTTSHALYVGGSNWATAGTSVCPYYGLRFWAELESSSVPMNMIITSLYGNSPAGAVATGATSTIYFDPATTNFRLYDFPDLSSLVGVQNERPSAQSVLVSYMGSTLDNGGVIAQALLPPGWSHLQKNRTNWYDYLASRAKNNRDGALKEGGYMFWEPESVHEYRFKPFGASLLGETSSLWVHIRPDDPSQSVRLRIYTCIEVLTTNPAYASTLGPVCPHFDLLMLALKHSVPNCTHNPGHKGVLQWFKDAAKKVWKVVKNPNTWHSIGKVAASAAPLLALV